MKNKRKNKTKEEVRNYLLKEHKVQSTYSGITKTLYFPEELHEAVIQKFGYNLPFTLGIVKSDKV